MSPAPKFFGCHVSASGGLERAIENGKALGVNTIQLHPCPPQRWNSKPFAPNIEREFIAQRADSGIEKVFFHGIYLINLATGNPSQLQLAKLSLIHSLDLISRLKGEGVIFHLGSMKDQADEHVGLTQAASTINQALAESPNDGRLLLEVAAGSGAIIGDRLEELAEVYDQVENKDRVGFALDTQHLWASGYKYDEDLEGFIEEVDRVFGLTRVAAIHLNDSKTERGSRKDRHENLGKGLIGEETLRRFFTHPKLNGIPFILETPAMKDLAEAADEVATLRRWGG